MGTAMHEMDCKNCKHGEIMKAGTYHLGGNVVMNLGSDTWKCNCEKIEVLDVSGDKDLCSNFEERELV